MELKLPVSPIILEQLSSLAQCLCFSLEFEVPVECTAGMQLIKDVLLSINSRFYSILIINDKKSSLSVYLTGQFLEILKKFRGPEAVVGAPQSICTAIVNYMGEQRVAAVAEKHFIDALHRECIN
ncbi:hypothetical protein Pint_02274 [Pistacia integerrima]|uniref:Uncharacterized protein n=1 Tax=Pistacia integerrima TaxID=434235 RepID=A0ACC0ZM67_9ROSI|nr:hypothetical protein Pint_02274 [Pistacia integerrima]